MLNPWFLAAGVMALVGLFEEVSEADKKAKPALPAPAKEKKERTGVTVNVTPTAVQSGKESKQVKPKPLAEVPTKPTGDG